MKISLIGGSSILRGSLLPLLSGIGLLISQATTHAQQYEAGVINTNHSWTQVNFSTPFDAPPVVVAGPAEYNGVNPSTVRVRNVSATGFQLRVDEWDYLDGGHTTENISYFALEEGVHTIGGLTWEAGRASNVTQGFRTVTLTAGFTSTPIVIGQIETMNNVYSGSDPTGLVNRIRNVSGTSFEIKIQDEEATTTAPAGEDIGYIAVSEGSGWLNGEPLLVARTGDLVSGNDSDDNGFIEPFTIQFLETYTNPVFVAGLQTQDGGDTVSLRHDNVRPDSIDIFLEEEESNDAEVSHTTEDIGMVVIGERRTAADAKIEAGLLTRNQADANTWYTVTLQNTYTNPVVVMGPVSNAGSDPSTIRVRNVTSNSFEYQVDEWDYKDGAHATTTHHFIAMEAGVYDIGGVRWQAGVFSGATHGYKTVNFADQFPVTPVVLAQAATDNEASAVSTFVRNVGRDSFQMKLIEEQLGPDTHAAEDVHYVAIQPGPSAFTANGTLYLFDVGLTGNTISDEGANNETQVAENGIDFVYETVPFPRTYDAPPILVAAMQTVNGGDPCALRYSSLNTSGFGVRVEEEQSEDLEVDHTNEVVGYLAATTYADADGDALPDAWETSTGLTDANGDPDGDGMTNLEEFLNDSNPSSADATIIQVATLDARGYEGTGAPASFNVTRANSNHAVTVFYNLGGAATADQPVASLGDYSVKDQNGFALGGAITLPQFVNSAQVYIHPVADNMHEYPELVELSLLTSPDYQLGGNTQADVDLADNTDDPENDTLFVGFYQAEGTAVTGASGIATLILNGSNTEGRLTTSYSGLTSPQVNAHIHKANSGPSSGPIMEPLPQTGQLQGYLWTIHSAGAGVYTVERLIDSLYNQNGESRLYANVHTVNYGPGEIWALFSEVQGSVEPPEPDDPPSIDQFNLSTAQGQENLRRDIARFLTQSTFGATQQTIEQLYAAVDADTNDDRIAVFEQWIDDQFALEQTLHLDYVVAADWQEWVMRKHFQPEGYPSTYYTGAPGTMPTAPAKPGAWPVMTGPSLSTFDSLVPSTWRVPSGPYPLAQSNINNRSQFDPNLGEVNHSHRRRASWTIYANAHDQLRQRLGFAWQEIMVASENLNVIRQRHYGASRWIDMLAENSDDTFRELLEDVTYSPVMGKYLSHLRNGSEAATGVPPDENYAREIMQLFSIGLVELWQDGTLRLDPTSGLVQQTYDNNDITELSRVLTGLSFSRYANNETRWDDPIVNNNTSSNATTIANNFNRGDSNKYYGATYEYPMHMFGNFHDLGAKTLGGINGVTIDNTSMSDGDFTDPTDEIAHGNQDLADMHDWLANHPNTAPFICTRLIQRLVTSNPSHGYVYRVSQRFIDTGGDLAEVTKAILLDYEARTLDLTDDENYGKMKEPILRYLQTLRALNASSELLVDGSGISGSDLTEYGYPASQADNFTGTMDYTSGNPLNPANNLPGSRYRYPQTDANLAQTPLAAPTVFNWFLPDYRPDGPIADAALVAPEFQITTETSVISSINYFWTLTWSLTGQSVNVLGSVYNANVSPPFTPQTDLGYSTNADNVIADFDAWVAKYNAYTGTEAERDQALIDELDLLLTSGNLAARYPIDSGDSDENPREILIDVLTNSFGTGGNGPREKVRTAFYLLTTSPEFVIQK